MYEKYIKRGKVLNDAVWNKDKDKMNNPYDCNYFKPKVKYIDSLRGNYCINRNGFEWWTSVIVLGD